MHKLQDITLLNDEDKDWRSVLRRWNKEQNMNE